MKVLTKYEVLETKELNLVEIEGIESILNNTYPEWENQIDCRYQETCLQPDYRLVIDKGEVNRIGMVNGRVVFEVNLLDQDEIATGESLMYWAEVIGGEFELIQMEVSK